MIPPVRSHRQAAARPGTAIPHRLGRNQSCQGTGSVAYGSGEMGQSTTNATIGMLQIRAIQRTVLADHLVYMVFLPWLVAFKYNSTILPF